jgi:hypothetical protein
MLTDCVGVDVFCLGLALANELKRLLFSRLGAVFAAGFDDD